MDSKKDISHNQVLLERNKVLQAKLNKSICLHRLFQAQDYQQVLLPVLQQACQIQWLDPLDKEFQAKYNLAYSRAQAFKEIIKLLEEAEPQMNKLRIELAEPEKNYQTGT